MKGNVKELRNPKIAFEKKNLVVGSKATIHPIQGQ